MAVLSFIATQNEDRPVSSASWINISGTSLSSIITTILNTYNSLSIGNNIKQTYSYYLKLINNNQTCVNQGDGQNYNYHSVLRFSNLTSADIAYYNSDLAGKRFTCKLYTTIPNSNGGAGAGYILPIYYFDEILPSNNNSETAFSIVTSKCLWELLEPYYISELTFNNSSMGSTVYANGCHAIIPEGIGRYGEICVSETLPPEDECIDSRTSENVQTLHFVISDGVSNAQTFDVNFNLSDGSNQEIGLLSPVLSDSAFNALLNVWNSQTGCQARCQFTGGVVRSSCRVKLVCKVYGQSCKVSPSLVPPFVQLNLSEYGGINAIDRNLLIADFDPCQDTAVSYSEDVTSYIQGLQQSEDFTVGFSFIQVVPYKVVIENCTALTDYCCDDNESVPADDETLGGYTKPLIQGYGGGSSGGGGGDVVDISCICTALSNINDTLSAFASANETALSGINDTLSALNIDIDNECICDNLENVVDGLGAIKDSIDDKQLSVTNNNTVQPPVNNVVVQPPVNNVSVNPPVNNVSVSVPTTELASISTNLSSIDDKLHCNNKNIACIIQDKHLSDKSDSIGIDFSSLSVDTSGIQDSLSDVANAVSNSSDSLVCDDKGIACILSEALNTSGLVSESITDVLKNSLNTSDDESESISDVIKNKEMGTNIDVEVSPADDVNINRVYYTNQRNGDTNL